jgi:hypothetical protein
MFSDLLRTDAEFEAGGTYLSERYHRTGSDWVVCRFDIISEELTLGEL